MAEFIPAGGLTSVSNADLGSDCIRRIQKITLTSAGTIFDFTGLDINSDNRYQLNFSGDNNTASSALISLFINGDYVGANYYAQVCQANGASVTSSRNNPGALMYMLGSRPISGTTSIYRTPDGYAFARAHYSCERGSCISFEDVLLSKIATVSNITSLRLSSEQALKIGSNATLYAMP